MDIFNKNKNEKDENKTKKVVKRHMLVAAVILAIKIFLMLLMIFAVVAVIEWLVKIFQPKNTVDKIYKELKIDDVSELVQIKGNEKDGYYLDFVDDIDKKLQDTIDYLNSTAGVKSGIDKEFLKKMIKTEVVTQMPDLGAEVSEDKGFQGITSILRITPNKDIGSFKNTGAGKETIKNEEDSNKNDMVNKSDIAKQEKEVKSWKKGKDLTLSAKAYVYSQEDSKLHPGEKIDYWPAQKNKNTLQNLYLSKGTTVKYTGEYSISLDKMNNEGIIYVGIEKDDIKGYIKYNFIDKDSGGNGSNNDDEVIDSGYVETPEEKITDTIDSNVYKLKYIPKKTFDEYVSNGNKEALYCFTIDDDNNLITATWSIGEDGKIEIQNNSAINLKTALQNYIVSSAYLLYYYIEADYPDFSNELADIALNSKIIMALEDNVSTSKIKRTVETKKVSESSEFSYDWTGGDPTEIITEYCSTKTEIIYADTWCVKIENKSLYKSDLLDVTVGKSKNIKIPGTVTENDGQEEISGEKETGSGTDTKEETNVVIENGKPIIKTTTYTYAYKTYQRTRIITDSISNSYAEADKVKPEAKEKVFTDLYKKHKMYNRLNDKRFLQILENDDRTANLVDLTKYLMYMATGVDYGVKEYDFSEYADTEFEDVNSIEAGGTAFEQFIKYLHAWEGGASQDGKYYIVQSDGSNGGSAVGHGVDIAANGAELRAAGYNTSIGSKIPVDVVDAIEKRVINSQLADIKSKTKGLNLKEYQIYALLTRQYNTGHFPSEFVNTYKTYWNSKKDDKYGKKDSVDYNHKLYTNLLSKPITSKLEVLNGLINRRKSEWLLFQTGYFDRGVNGYCSTDSVESGTIGAILSKAKEIHECLEKNKASWSVDILPTYEEIRNSKYVCCANYVSAVLIDAGCIDKSEYTPGAATLESVLARKNSFKKISNYSDLKAGDIVFMTRENSTSGTGHVQIFAGNSKWYNTGSTGTIQDTSPKSSTDSYVKGRFICAYRYVK